MHPLVQRLHDGLRDRLRAARLRRRAERALPRAERWRRSLRRGLLQLSLYYVALDLLAVTLLDVVVAGRITCRVVDAATGLPLRDATVCIDGGSTKQSTDAGGFAELRIVTAPEVVWALPLLGSYRFGGHLHVTADGYVPADATLPEAFDWPLFGEPRAERTVRMQR